MTRTLCVTPIYSFNFPCFASVYWSNGSLNFLCWFLWVDFFFSRSLQQLLDYEGSDVEETFLLNFAVSVTFYLLIFMPRVWKRLVLFFILFIVNMFLEVLRYRMTHDRSFLLNLSINVGCRYPSCHRVEGEVRPWTGHQWIAGITKSDRKPIALIITPVANLALLLLT